MKLRYKLLLEAKREGYAITTSGRKGSSKGMSDEESRKETDLQRNPGSRGRQDPTDITTLINPKALKAANARLASKAKRAAGGIKVHPATGLPIEEPKPEKKAVKKAVKPKPKKKVATRRKKVVKKAKEA